MIEIDKLTKRFGTFTAVDEVSLHVEAGNIFAFLGTNGAGKTTSIRMMTGVLQPTSGTVKIGGYDIQKNPIEAKFLMGVIPDRPYIYGKLTGNEFLEFMGDLYQVDRKLQTTRIPELLETFGLLRREHDLIDSYSHGMKQRLLMCAALVHNPPVLIVDEPMVGLDPKGAKLLKDTFRERAKRGLTIFMSTHSLPVAQEIANQLAIIQRGKIVASGSLTDLYNRAQSGTSDLQQGDLGQRDLEQAFLQILSETEDGTEVLE
jgi:ABC-2 type transport system ATP-binding protein